jgi:hypothetical protein
MIGTMAQSNLWGNAHTTCSSNNSSGWSLLPTSNTQVLSRWQATGSSSSQDVQLSFFQTWA